MLTVSDRDYSWINDIVVGYLHTCWDRRIKEE
jgi:hypothetical protein